MITYRTTPSLISRYENTAVRTSTLRARRVDCARVEHERADKKFLVVSFIIIAIIVFSVLIGHGVADAARFSYAEGLPRISVVVSPGDTIDGIASQHMVSGLSAHELGIVIAKINEGKHSVPLMPGDVLAVPVENAE